MTRRTTLERERDLDAISKQYLHGVTQAQIAENFNVSQQQISRDLKELRNRWLKSSLANLDALKAQELAKVDALEKEYWDAWNRSIGERKRKSTERATANGEDKNKASIITEEMIGDPRYLEGVQKCIERRCKLLGLDSPDRRALTDSQGNDIEMPKIVQVVAAKLTINDDNSKD